ncbi:MAG: ATP-binding protein [Merismopedia sp. SIO2A8]|nr:ATP-binding protein [Symploca sp. SIO2B6]NET49521.1 ATP-binding protein [Merismopedia sp. SIO2A8]
MAQSQLATQTPVEVVAAPVDITKLLTKTADIEESFKTTFINTDRSSQCFRWLDELRFVKQCGRVVGPRDVGKSRSLIEYRENNDNHVSYVRAWSNSSSKRLFSQILKDINHAAPQGKQQDLRTRLAGSLGPFGIELLLIDNADNLQPEALMDLKQLHDESGVPIVLVGGQLLDDRLCAYDLLTCFPTLFDFDRFELEDFQITLRTIEREILKLPQTSNLSEGISFEILTISTDYRIGVLIKILVKAVLHSLKKGHSKVDEDILAHIASRYGRRYVPIEARKDK